MIKPGYPWWKLIWHWIRGHELTHGGLDYPSPVCRECELDKLYNKREIVKHRLPFDFITFEDAEKMLNELAEARGITRAQFDKELEEAANKEDGCPCHDGKPCDTHNGGLIV